jgi:hypothetical protein
MTDHLPECYLSGPPNLCPMCEALRACEQRARQDERTRMSPEWVYQQGYDNGLYDARIAVMKLCEKQPSTWPTSEAAMDELTDTINALKEQP